MSEKKVTSVSNINVQVGLDAAKVPTTLHWQAEDDPENSEPKECKAMLLSFFDKEHRDTFKIDLWTQEMQVGEMDRFVYQTLRGLADTYFKATQNKDLANTMQQFIQFFGEQTEILPKSDKA